MIRKKIKKGKELSDRNWAGLVWNTCVFSTNTHEARV